MRIGIDMSPAVHRRAGIGRYAGELARALLSLGSEHRFTAVFNRAAQAAREEVPSGMGEKTLPDADKTLRLKTVWAHMARRSQRAAFPEIDVFHATDNLLPYLPGVKSVLNLYDLSYLTTDTASLPNKLYLRLMMGRYLRAADAVITLSAATMAEGIRRYGLAPERVVTVDPGVSSSFVPPRADAVAAVRKRYGLPARFILFVGTIEPRKNLGMLLEAFRALRQTGERTGLVLAGRVGWRSEGFFTTLRALGLEDEVRLAGYVPDADLPALYGAAAVFVLPSLCEGFGLPVIEAMACGTPVVASGVSSLPEVVGDAGLLADPYRPADWTAALGRVLSEPGCAETLREKGFRRAGEFGWERAARHTMAIYERVAAGKAV